MYAVTGVTGQVGGAVARALVARGHGVRAVLRTMSKAPSFKDIGCEVANADLTDPESLTRAFTGVEGVFILIPPMFDPAPGFPEVRVVIDALKTALETARPPKAVCLSTIGAQAPQPNLLNQLGLAEQELGLSPVPIAFLRAAWFMENAIWDVAPARTTGRIPSFLQPLDKPVPMVATIDIGRLAASLLEESWSGRRIVELEGPRRVTPNELAAGFAALLGRPVVAEAVARETWESLFTAQGMKHPRPRAQMLDGFNDGWIEFEAGEGGSLKGTTAVDAVLRTLVSGTA